MKFSDELDFSHRDRKDIYEYVERMGSIDYEEAQQALNMNPEAFGMHVTALSRDGVIEHVEAEDGDTLRIAFQDLDIETYEVDGQEFTIRQAHEDDLDGLVAAMHETLDDETYVVGENIAEKLEHENVLLRRNEVESRMFFVASVDGEVVGWVHLNHPEHAALEHTAELTVGVVPGHRQEGIGEKLLDRASRWGRENGYEKLYNSVPASNDAAVSFLEDHGWETEATRDGHYHIDGERVGEVMLATWL